MYRKQWVGLGKREDETHFHQNIDNIVVVSYGPAVSLDGSNPHLWVHAGKVGFCLTYWFGVIICLIPINTSEHPRLLVATKNSIFITPVLFKHCFSTRHLLNITFCAILIPSSSLGQRGNGNVPANINDDTISSGSILPRNSLHYYLLLSTRIDTMIN